MTRKKSDTPKKEKDVQAIKLVTERLGPHLDQFLKKHKDNKSEVARLLGFEGPRSINFLLKGTGWSIGNILRLCALDNDFRKATVRLILDVNKEDLSPGEPCQGEQRGARGNGI